MMSLLDHDDGDLHRVGVARLGGNSRSHLLQFVLQNHRKLKLRDAITPDDQTARPLPIVLLVVSQKLDDHRLEIIDRFISLATLNGGGSTEFDHVTLSRTVDKANCSCN